MTRLAVVSDIHGNLPALKAVLADMAAFAVDQVVVAGDIIDLGPFSVQVAERVAHEGWTVVRGNNELYFLDFKTPRAPAEWDDVSHFPIPPWLHQQLHERWHDTIAGWQESVQLRFTDAPPLRVFHGSPRSLWEPIYPISSEEEIRAVLAKVEETTVIAGHTHLAMDRQAGRWRILNPGSVGVPLDGIFSASHMILDGNAEGWRATFRRVPFDYEPLFQEFERLDFVEKFGVVGHFIVQEFKTARLQLVPFLHWHEAHCPDAPFSMALLDEFGRVNRRDYLPMAYRHIEDHSGKG